MRAQLSANGAVHVLDAVTRAVLQGAPVTPRIEGQVQDALTALKRSADAENIRRAERVSTILFKLVQAKHNGRPNLHASQLVRLARI